MKQAPCCQLLHAVVLLHRDAWFDSEYSSPLHGAVSDVYCIRIEIRSAVMVLVVILEIEQSLLCTWQWLHGFAPSPVVLSVYLALKD